MCADAFLQALSVSQDERFHGFSESRKNLTEQNVEVITECLKCKSFYFMPKRFLLKASGFLSPLGASLSYT